MKKKILQGFCMAFVLIVFMGSVFGAEVPTYKGIVHGDELLKNISYGDIGKDPNRDAIIRLSALGIIRGRNEHRFYPNDALTREEALMFILRLMGEEEAAQKAGEALVINPDDKKNKQYLPTQYWAEGYIKRAQDLNLVSQEEAAGYVDFSDDIRNRIDSLVERDLKRYESNNNYTDAQVKIIEDQIRRNLEWQEAYQKPVDRETFAMWVSKAMNLTPIYAKEQQSIRRLKDFQTIKTVNLPYVEALYQQGIMKGFSDGTFRPDRPITRSQGVGVIDTIKLPFLQKQNYKISYAYVQEIEGQNEYNMHLKNFVKSYLLKDESGTVIRWTTENHEKPNESLSFIIHKNGVLTDSNVIKIHDYYQYYVDDKDRVVFAETPKEPHLMEGIISKLYYKKNGEENVPYVQIKDEKGKLTDLMVSSFAHIRINDRYGHFENLIRELSVKVKHFGGIAEEILAGIEVENPDYILPYARVYTGKLLSLQQDFMEVSTDQGLLSFDRDKKYLILKNDKQITPEQLREGDLLRVEMSEKNTNTPERVVVLDQSKEVDHFYKGYLERVDYGGKKLLLRDVQRYQYLGYDEKNPMQKFDVDRTTKYKTLESSVPFNRMKHYQGREIYFWTEYHFGKEIVRAATVKEGFEKSYLDGVKQVSFGKKTLNLSDAQLQYDDSSLFVKDGRLVDPRVIKEGDNLYVIAHGKGNISLASIENLPLPDYHVYRGKILDISTYELKIENDIYGLLTLQNNVWKKLKGYVAAPFNDETVIWDRRNYESKQVPVKRLLQEKYLKAKDGGFVGASVYALTYQGEIIGLQIVDENTLTAQFNFGTVKENGAETNMTLTEIKTWDNFAKAFVSQTYEMPLDFSQAIVVKDGRAIAPTQLRQGDKLYVSRKDNQVYYAMVLE